MAVLLALLVSPLVLGACGGGGGGSSGSDDQGGDVSDAVAALVVLDAAALNGQMDVVEFVEALDQWATAVDAVPGGPQSLADYLDGEVAGGSFSSSARVPAPKTLQQAFADLKQTTAYQTVEAFVTTVASSLLLPDPVGMLLELGQPEVFVSLASVKARANIYEALVNNEIDPVTAASLADRVRRNPFDAHKGLLEAKSETVPEWVETVGGVCLRDCPPVGGTGMYSGPFSGTMTETGLGCVWEHSLSGIVDVTVTGSGTLADPYEGAFDVSGTIATVLVSGTECDPGGGAPIEDFFGSVSGTSGKVEAEGDGFIGTAPFVATLTNGTVSGSTLTATFFLDLGMDNAISSPVSLARQ
jgi:hypothetical protein